MCVWGEESGNGKEEKKEGKGRGREGGEEKITSLTTVRKKMASFMSGCSSISKYFSVKMVS